MLTKLGLESLNSFVTPVEPNITISYADWLARTFAEADKELMRGVDYRQTVGYLLWIDKGARPYITYVSQVSRFL